MMVVCSWVRSNIIVSFNPWENVQSCFKSVVLVLYKGCPKYGRAGSEGGVALSYIRQRGFCCRYPGAGVWVRRIPPQLTPLSFLKNKKSIFQIPPKNKKGKYSAQQ